MQHLNFLFISMSILTTEQDISRLPIYKLITAVLFVGGSSGGGGGGPERVVPFMLSPISSHNSSHGSGRSNLSPGMTSYLRQNLASTPLTTNRGNKSYSIFQPVIYFQLPDKSPTNSMTMSSLNKNAFSVTQYFARGFGVQQIKFFVPIHFCRVPRSSVVLGNLQKNADAWKVFCQTQGRSAASAKSSSLPLGNFVSEVCPFCLFAPQVWRSILTYKCKRIELSQFKFKVFFFLKNK